MAISGRNNAPSVNIQKRQEALCPPVNTGVYYLVQCAINY